MAITPSFIRRQQDAGIFYCTYEGAKVEPQIGQCFCMYYVVDPADHGYDAPAQAHDGSLVRYEGHDQVSDDNCDDEDKDTRRPGGDFEHIAILQG